MFSITDYRCVVALQEERSFARAAAVIGISQPALTGRLRRIEEQVGVKLFDRGRRGAEPTPAGNTFTDAARRIVDLAEQAVGAARDADRGLGQHLRIGMTQVAALQLVVPILAAFRRENPYTRVRLVEGTSATLETQVEQNLIDAAFLHPPVHQAGLSELHLVSQSVVRCTAGRAAAPDAPTIRYIRREAPVLVAEIDRKQPQDIDRHALAEVDTVLGAIVLSHAGYGPFLAPENYPSPFGAPVDAQPVDIELGTSIVWRSLDRRPMVRALLDICRRS